MVPNKVYRYFPRGSSPVTENSSVSEVPVDFVVAVSMVFSLERVVSLPQVFEPPAVAATLTFQPTSAIPKKPVLALASNQTVSTQLASKLFETVSEQAVVMEFETIVSVASSLEKPTVKPLDGVPFHNVASRNNIGTLFT